MTLHCRNGHRIGPHIITDFGAGTGDYCPTCRVPLSRPIEPDPVPLWPLLAVVLAAFILVGAFWWIVFFAPA